MRCHKAFCFLEYRSDRLCQPLLSSPSRRIETTLIPRKGEPIMDFLSMETFVFIVRKPALKCLEYNEFGATEISSRTTASQSVASANNAISSIFPQRDRMGGIELLFRGGKLNGRWSHRTRNMHMFRIYICSMTRCL